VFSAADAIVEANNANPAVPATRHALSLIFMRISRQSALYRREFQSQAGLEILTWVKRFAACVCCGHAAFLPVS
jgi:hypothetical protein